MNKYDMMIACNRKTSEEKINRAVTEIRQMLTDREKVTVPKLVKRTGLSRGFFYKNETVRTLRTLLCFYEMGNSNLAVEKLEDTYKYIVDSAFDEMYIIRKLKQKNTCLRIIVGMKKCGQVTYEKQLQAALEEEKVEL